MTNSMRFMQEHSYVNVPGFRTVRTNSMHYLFSIYFSN